MSNTPIVDALIRKNIDQWHGAKLSALKQAEQIKATAQFTFELGLLAQQLERHAMALAADLGILCDGREATKALADWAAFCEEHHND
mgnify:CR=1 FL=1